MFSENQFNQTLINTMMMIVKTWHDITKCLNKLLYTLGDGVFGVAGQTKALSYWWIGFLEILHGATSHHTCQCENLRLLSQSVNRASHKTFCAHRAIGRNANRTVKLKGAPILKWKYSKICRVRYYTLSPLHVCKIFLGRWCRSVICAAHKLFFRKIIGGSGIVTSSSAVAEKPRCRLCQFWVGGQWWRWSDNTLHQT